MTGKASTISVVVPTHGRVTLLKRALASIAGQTLLPDEVLVVDDLDDPATRSLVADCARDFPATLTYLHNAVQPGACGSRNLGARTSSSALIAFLDDDDLWRESFLRNCAEALSVPAVDFALSSIDRCFPDGSVKPLTTATGLTPANVLHQRVHMTGSNFVIRRQAFEAVNGFDVLVPVFNDWDLFIRLVRTGCRYQVVPEQLVCWMEHGGDRITTATLRRADGIDRFLTIYGDDMSPDMRAYFLRLAFGIRRANEPSVLKRAILTGDMLRQAGLRGATTILGRSLAQKA